jgi:hypothetical protein
VKCDKCKADSPVAIAKLDANRQIVTSCMDCLYGAEETVGAIDPPLGWRYPKEEEKVMTSYKYVAWHGKEN